MNKLTKRSLKKRAGNKKLKQESVDIFAENTNIGPYLIRHKMLE